MEKSTDFFKLKTENGKWKLIFRFQLSTFFGRSATRRAFRSIFARYVITSLAKDAAAIPNATCKKVETSPLWRLKKKMSRLFNIGRDESRPYKTDSQLSTFSFQFSTFFYGLNPEPPCNVIVSPVTYDASSDAKKTHTLPMSFIGSAKRPNGIPCIVFSNNSG